MSLDGLLGLGVLDPRVVVAHGVMNVKPELIRGNSIDLTVREVYVVQGGVTLRADGSRQLPAYSLVTPDHEGFYALDPATVYQFEFEQSVDLPHWMCGITMIRSSMAKSGCSGENGLFDSGYRGSTGMMIRVGHRSYVQRGAAVAQMVFFRAHAEGALYEGFYQETSGPSEWSGSVRTT